MAKPLKNISDLFKNTRTRSILIVTIGLIILGIVVGVISLRKRVGAPSRAGLQGTPQIQSIPGGFEKPETQEYVALQEKQNRQQAEAARKAGTSAVPTIVSAIPISGGWQGGSTINTGGGLPNNYLLRTGGPADAEGVPVYNAQGQMTGIAYGKGDKVCVVNCSATGTVSPDGLIRDARGNVIGKVAASALGTPVYDADGRLIGYAGADGKVRNPKGVVVGSVGSDGIFRNNAGACAGGLGAPVYDTTGRLLGYTAPNGVVRGLNGNLLGKVGSDGTVRAPNGNTLGKVASSALGTPVFGTTGGLIGYAGSDGKVRDLCGNVVGTVDADGNVRDLNGKIIGKTTPPTTGRAPSVRGQGTPVYDKNGNLIGTADANGTIRDPNGKVVGNLAADGTLRDANGNIIGSVATPTKASGTGLPSGTTAGTIGGPSGIGPSESDRLQDARQRQQQQAEQQQAMQNLQQLTSSMNTQQGLLFTSWSSNSTQQYVEGTKPKEETTTVTHTTEGGTTTTVETVNPGVTDRYCPMMKAGTILFATLNTAVNSDEPGPVMATIVGNRLRGGKLLGTLINQGQKVMLTFNVLNLPNVPDSIPVNAVAIDPCTARTALSSDTDNHYLLRYGSLFAASFLQGYGQAILQSGQTVVSNGLNTIVTNDTLTPKREALAALGTVGQAWGEAIRPLFNKPPTVQVFACTPLGILIMSDVAAPTNLNCAPLPLP